MNPFQAAGKAEPKLSSRSFANCCNHSEMSLILQSRNVTARPIGRGKRRRVGCSQGAFVAREVL